MSGVAVIFKKETQGFFKSPVFWVLGFFVTVILSYVFPIQLELFAQMLTNYMMQPGVPQNQLNIHYAVFLRELSYLNLMLILVVPGLTMKLLSEEKKLRTFDLLLTSPITSLDIVLGKFLAAAAATGALLLIAFLYPLATSAFTKFSWGPLLIAFFGIYVVSLVYVAMNMFASSLTENSLISFVMAVVLNVSVWFIGVGAEVADGETSRKIFEHISMSSHLGSLVEGTVRTQGLIFFASLIVFFCFLSERVVESARWR